MASRSTPPPSQDSSSGSSNEGRKRSGSIGQGTGPAAPPPAQYAYYGLSQQQQQAMYYSQQQFQQQQQQAMYNPQYPMPYPQQPQPQQYQQYSQQEMQQQQQYQMQYQQGYPPQPSNGTPIMYHSNQAPIPVLTAMPMQMPMHPQAAPYAMQPQGYGGSYPGYPSQGIQVQHRPIIQQQQAPLRSSSHMHAHAAQMQHQQQQHQRMPPPAGSSGLSLQPKQIPQNKPYQPNAPASTRTPSPNHQPSIASAGVPVARIKSRSPSVASMFERPSGKSGKQQGGQPRKRDDEDNASITSTSSTKSFSGFMSGFKRGIMRGIGLKEDQENHRNNGHAASSDHQPTASNGKPVDLGNDLNAIRIQQHQQQGMVRGIYPSEPPVILQKYPGPPPGFVAANSFGPTSGPPPPVGPLQPIYPNQYPVVPLNSYPPSIPPPPLGAPPMSIGRPAIDFSKPPPFIVSSKPTSPVLEAVPQIPEITTTAISTVSLLSGPVVQSPSPPPTATPDPIAIEILQDSIPKNGSLSNRFSFDERESIDARPVAIKQKASQLSLGGNIASDVSGDEARLAEENETVKIQKNAVATVDFIAPSEDAPVDTNSANNVTVVRSNSRKAEQQLAVRTPPTRKFTDPGDVSPSYHPSLLARSGSLRNKNVADSSAGLSTSPHRSATISGHSSSANNSNTQYSTRSLDRSLGRGKKPLSANGTLSRSPLPPSPTPGSSNFIQSIMHEDVMQTHRDVSHLFWVDDAVVGPDVHPAKLLADAEAAVGSGAHAEDLPDFGSLLRKRSMLSKMGDGTGNIPATSNNSADAKSEEMTFAESSTLSRTRSFKETYVVITADTVDKEDGLLGKIVEEPDTTSDSTVADKTVVTADMDAGAVTPELEIPTRKPSVLSDAAFDGVSLSPGVAAAATATEPTSEASPAAAAPPNPLVDAQIEVLVPPRDRDEFPITIIYDYSAYSTPTPPSITVNELQNTPQVPMHPYLDVSFDAEKQPSQAATGWDWFANIGSEKVEPLQEEKQQQGAVAVAPAAESQREPHNEYLLPQVPLDQHTASDISDNEEHFVYPNNSDPFNGFPRFPLHLEKAIYQLSHAKLAQPRRPLIEQVMVSNLMLYILSVHADVTLQRQGPRKKRGGKKKKGSKKRSNKRASLAEEEEHHDLYQQEPVQFSSHSSAPLVVLNGSDKDKKRQSSDGMDLEEYVEQRRRRRSSAASDTASIESNGSESSWTSQGESDRESESESGGGLGSFFGKKKSGKKSGGAINSMVKGLSMVMGRSIGRKKTEDDDDVPLGILVGKT
ncbi:UNVERIFIED_CONTAM: hypothetical protein HDU68_005233 [Siphonaria sp. JEL0065]|nr:hypothetical protein HDU68_005233 [Siphonaria sp. JEL0065]